MSSSFRYQPKLKHLLFFLICISWSSYGLSQNKLGFYMPEDARFVEMDFENNSNLIIIPITINDQIRLKFILDTGAESAILTEKLFGDMIGLDYIREINIITPGEVDSLRAYVASGITMSLDCGIKGEGINMLVLEDDYLELDKNLGEEIYGVIGYDIFSRFIVSIDYDNEKIRFYNQNRFKAKYAGEVVDMTLDNTKPYITTIINQGETTDTVKLLVDSGASHALLLDVDHTQGISLPTKVLPTQLGQGLGGEITGYLGRMNTCKIGNNEIEDVLVSIPHSGAYLKAIKRGSRHGTVGGDILSRFNVTFDYEHEKLYLDRGKTYEHGFETNMSGMILGTDGENLKKIVVLKVQPDTPAHDAGLQRGDVILKINGFSTDNSTLSELNGLLRRHPGYRMKVVLLRDGVKLKHKFQLERLI